MADEEWSRHGLFDPALVRRIADDQIKVEQPPDSDVARASSPPVPDQKQLEPLVILHNPQLAGLWFQGDTGEAGHRMVPADQQPDDRATIAQLGMALYLLQTLHSQDHPGSEHLARNDGFPPDEDEDREDG